jgi:hypothetical protein
MSCSRLAQRRQGDLEHAETIVEILAELAALHRRVQVAIRCGDDADVGVQQPCAAERRMNSRSSSTRSSLACTDGAISPTSSRKQDAMLACSMRPAWRHRAGERATLVAEQLRFEQLVGQCGAVNRDERSVAAARGMVDERATTSLPVPDSPVSSTVVSVCAHTRACASTSRHTFDWPTTRRCPVRASSSRGEGRDLRFEPGRRLA